MTNTPRRARQLPANDNKKACPLLEKMKREGDLYDKIVTVEVDTGASKQSHYMHEGLLCHHSSYFRGAIKGGFAESRDRTVRLKDLDNKVFAAFKDWIYTGTMPAYCPDRPGPYYELLVKLWVFGDMRGIPALQNATMDSLLMSMGEYWELPTILIPYIYGNTPEKSALRKAIVEAVGFFWSDMEDWLEKDSRAMACPLEFYQDMLRLRGRANGVKITSQEEYKKIDKCQYHVHDAPDEGRPSA